jgi:hypothetical protein
MSSETGKPQPQNDALGLDSIGEPETPSAAPTAAATDEAAALDRERQEVELGDYRQNVELRKKFAYGASLTVIGWLAAMLAIVFFAGFRVGGFVLEPAVLIALITTTTGSVLGVLLIVMRYLFPR